MQPPNKEVVRKTLTALVLLVGFQTIASFLVEYEHVNISIQTHDRLTDYVHVWLLTKMCPKHAVLRHAAYLLKDPGNAGIHFTLADN